AVVVALCPPVHDGRRHRQRVQRGGGSVVPERAHRDRPRPVHHHADSELSVSTADLEHGAQRQAGQTSSRAGRQRGNCVTRDSFRKLVSSVFVAFCALCVALALVPLALILFFLVSQGIQALNLSFFTRMPLPVGEPGGGMANSIVGTLILTGLGSLFAVPIGVLSGVYMS